MMAMKEDVLLRGILKANTKEKMLNLQRRAEALEDAARAQGVYGMSNLRVAQAIRWLAAGLYERAEEEGLS